MRHSLRDMLTLFSDDSYQSRVLAQNPIAYFPVNEGSGTVITDLSGNGFNGVSTGFTWDGTTRLKGGYVPLLDGASDFGNIYSAGLGGAFNFDEFTIIVWAKVSGAGVWSDGASRDLFRIYRDADNSMSLRKSPSSAVFTATRKGDGTAKSIISGTLSDIDFFCLAFSASIDGGGLLAAGDLRLFKDGVQEGSTITGNIASTGSGLDSTRTLLGAASTAPSFVWDGWEGQMAIFDRPMDSGILALTG